MLLVFDVGNSDVTIGLWNRDTWLHVWRIPSKADQPELFYGVKVRDFFLESRLSFKEVSTVVVSSVVPGLTEKIRNLVRNLFQHEPVILGPKVYEKLPIGILNPYEIGSDLVANAMAAHVLYKRACIVVDFGTALTFTTINGEGTILGVSIAPGLRTAIRSLTQNTAKLFDVPLEMPASALGKNTITAIQTGILFGYEGMVKSVVSRIQGEIGEDCHIIATGGLSSIITSLQGFFDVVEPNLTLHGLRLVGEHIANS